MHHTTNRPLKPYIKYAIFSTAISLAASFYCQADVYKWTDENGNTHYSDIKPNDIKSKTLKIKTSKPQAPQKTPQTAAKELSEKNEQALQEKSNKLKEATEKRELEAKCEAIRNDLKTLQENSRIMVNDKEERRFLSPEEIEAKKQNYMKKLSEHCSD